MDGIWRRALKNPATDSHLQRSAFQRRNKDSGDIKWLFYFQIQSKTANSEKSNSNFLFVAFEVLFVREPRGMQSPEEDGGPGYAGLRRRSSLRMTASAISFMDLLRC